MPSKKNSGIIWFYIHNP
jgi:hypothetical protein